MLGVDAAPKLSAGTRDQLYLITRLAVARYLANGDVVAPLILDDPFVTTDDERFASGMRFLVDNLASERQILLLSCHEARHRWLLMAEPQLAGKVRTIQLESNQTS